MKKQILIIFFIFMLIGIKIQANNYQDQQDLLKMSLRDLMNIEITTANKTETEIKNTPESIIIITRDQIKSGDINLLLIFYKIFPGFI